MDPGIAGSEDVSLVVLGGERIMLSKLEVDTLPHRDFFSGSTSLLGCSMSTPRVPGHEDFPSRKKRCMLCEPSIMSMVRYV